MRYFFDTEFIEDGKTIDLISIGIVAEDGREYYAINRDCDFSKASDWVKENVIAKLPPRHRMPMECSPREWEESLAWKSKAQITVDATAFLKNLAVGGGYLSSVRRTNGLWNGLMGLTGIKDCSRWSEDALEIFGFADFEEPEIWAYYADYDWVVLCQLWGTMMDLPQGFPRYCRDIKQECDRLGNPQLPIQKNKHHALADARWNKKAWAYLQGAISA